MKYEWEIHRDSHYVHKWYDWSLWFASGKSLTHVAQGRSESRLRARRAIRRAAKRHKNPPKTRWSGEFTL